MQDSAKLLGFDATRKLNFSSSRALSIPVNRPLQFDLNRELGFDPARQLPFGLRGVMFRGYVCPVCGAAVLADAANCDECGTIFAAPREERAPAKPAQSKSQDYREQKDMKPRQPPQQSRRHAAQKPARKEAPRQPAMRESPSPAAPARKPSTFQCPVCNASVPVGSATCPKCSIQFSLRTPPPPEDALVLCPICDLKVASRTDYCTRCGEPLSPGAIARHKREMETMKRNRTQAEQPGFGRVGEPHKVEPTSQTITWEEYMQKKKGGGYR